MEGHGNSVGEGSLGRAKPVTTPWPLSFLNENRVKP